MGIAITPVALDLIVGLRELYRAEMNCQIVHDSLHERGFTDSYLIKVDDQPAAYASLVGFDANPKVTVKEFFVLPAFRDRSRDLFRAAVQASGATRIEAQSNDGPLMGIVDSFASGVERESILFADETTTLLPSPSATFRRIEPAERAGIFEHTIEPVGDWALAANGAIVATGGLMFHYNPPYGDIYMEVAAPVRRRGFGSYLVQELKRVCREMGMTPAARCRIANIASRATLQKAGMTPCGYILRAALAI